MNFLFCDTSILFFQSLTSSAGFILKGTFREGCPFAFLFLGFLQLYKDDRMMWGNKVRKNTKQNFTAYTFNILGKAGGQPL